MLDRWIHTLAFINFILLHLQHLPLLRLAGSFVTTLRGWGLGSVSGAECKSDKGKGHRVIC